MRKARPVFPTDLPALVAYNGRVYPNEARPRERLGTVAPTPNPIETAFEQLFPFLTGRYAWISARRQRLKGLVSARRRGGRQAWEIDCLIDTTPHFDAVPGLLDCAAAEAGRSGAEKLFLRLGTSSAFLPLVREQGFVTYAAETLYSLTLPIEGEVEAASLRAYSRQDLYPVYRLYNAVFSEKRRRSEAATFSEWQASLERQWLKGGVQLVSEEQGELRAWVAAACSPQGMLVDLVLTEASPPRVAALIAAAAKAAGGRPPFLALAPQGSPLAVSLEALGFQPGAEFTALVFRTARVAKLPKLVPAIAVSR